MGYNTTDLSIQLFDNSRLLAFLCVFRAGDRLLISCRPQWSKYQFYWLTADSSAFLSSWLDPWTDPRAGQDYRVQNLPDIRLPELALGDGDGASMSTVVAKLNPILSAHNITISLNTNAYVPRVQNCVRRESLRPSADEAIQEYVQTRRSEYRDTMSIPLPFPPKGWSLAESLYMLDWLTAFHLFRDGNQICYDITPQGIRTTILECREYSWTPSPMASGDNVESRLPVHDWFELSMFWELVSPKAWLTYLPEEEALLLIDSPEMHATFAMLLEDMKLPYAKK